MKLCFQCLLSVRLVFMSCAGWGTKAVQTFKILKEKFPDNMELKRELGVSHLLVGQLEPARLVFQEVRTCFCLTTVFSQLQDTTDALPCHIHLPVRL